MKRLSMVALLAAAVASAGCKKKSQPKPAPTAPAPAGSAAPPAGSATAPAGSATAPAGSATPPAMSDAEFEAMMAEMVAMLSATGKAVDAAGGDCGKAAGGVNFVADKNAAALARFKAHNQDPAVAPRIEAWMQAHTSEVMGPSMQIANAAQKCATDVAFQQAMQRLTP